MAVNSKKPLFYKCSQPPTSKKGQVRDKQALPSLCYWEALT